MRAISTSSFVSSSTVVNTVFVETVGDFFRFVRGSALTASSNYVVTSSDGLGQWFRMGIPNPTLLAAIFWAVDPAGGNDENKGWGATQADAEAVPLKTLAELNRRWSGNPGFSTRVIVSIMGDIPLTDAVVLANARCNPSGSARVNINGKRKAAILTGVVGGYTAKNTGAGTGETYLMNLTGAASYVGKMIEDEDRRYCFVLDAASANVARISTPMNEIFGPVTNGIPAEPGSMVNGKAFGVYDFYQMPSWPFPSSGIDHPRITNLALGNGITVNFDNPALGTTQPSVMKCQVEGSNGGNGTSGCWSGGFVFWGGCLFRNGGSGGVAFMNHWGNFHCPSFLGIRASFLNGSGCRFQEETMIYNASILMDETSTVGGVVGSTPRLQFGVFGTTGTVISGGRFRLPSDGGSFYGANNSGTLLAVPQGSSYSLPKAGSTCACSGTVLSVGGTSKTFADIPFINPTNGAAVTDGT